MSLVIYLQWWHPLQSETLATSEKSSLVAVSLPWSEIAITSSRLSREILVERSAFLFSGTYFQRWQLETKEKRQDDDGFHLSQSLSLSLQYVCKGLRTGIGAQTERMLAKKKKKNKTNHLSAQPRLEEAGLEERALNSRESRLDPPQDSKAPWNRSSILRRSSSSSIASSSRGLRCWSTCEKK